MRHRILDEDVLSAGKGRKNVAGVVGSCPFCQSVTARSDDSLPSIIAFAGGSIFQVC
jgi:hypothetical protein